MGAVQAVGQAKSSLGFFGVVLMDGGHTEDGMSISIPRVVTEKALPYKAAFDAAHSFCSSTAGAIGFYCKEAQGIGG
ncbi:hypothetical protein [Chitinilyticum aquatile]|uniref:hypothetical protein n=1 Tax=Chitinilyticum aquatile TaxID=362520 RepID=UPI0012DEFE73|nr:hypothetical protein [Chitinilyticum aquatile]